MSRAWFGVPIRAMGTVFRVGLQSAIAYRAETLIWILSTTMPAVMLLLWEAVASDGPIGAMSVPAFRRYFLATYIVRQLCGCWVAWQINVEMRDGTFALRLLRPSHPIGMLAIEQLASTAFRCLLSLPIALVVLAIFAPSLVPCSPVAALVLVTSLVGGWLLTFYVNVLAGFAAFYTDQSNKFMDLWTAFFFALSGYLIPTSLFPPMLVHTAEVLPFRFQLGFPVEVMTGLVPLERAWGPLALQWVYVAVFALASWALFARGVRRFSAQGG